jgi:hypothetical protein
MGEEQRNLEVEGGTMEGDPVQAGLDAAMKRIGELTMQNELLWQRVRKPALWPRGACRNEPDGLRGFRQAIRGGAGVRRVGACSLHVLRSSAESVEAGPRDQAGQARSQAVLVGCRAPRSDSARPGGISLPGRRAPQGVGAVALRARATSVSQAGASAHAGEPTAVPLP